MSIGLGIGVPTPKQLRSIYSVAGKVPGFTADFIKNKYPGHTSLSSAITHARAGNAVMTDGYGPELVTNGGFDSDVSSWTASSGTLSYSDGRAVLQNSGASSALATQVITTVVGKTYTVSADVDNETTNSNCRLYAGTTSGGTDLLSKETTNGELNKKTLEGVFIATGTTTYISISNRAISNAYAYFDNVSVREMPALKWAPHNLLSYSEDFSQSVWTAVGGTLTADSFVDDSSANAHYFFSNIATITTTQHTLGLEVKAYDDAQYFQIALGTGDVSGNPFVNFDLLAGTVVKDDDSIGTITDIGDGWYRCKVSVTSAVTSSFGFIGVAITNSTNSRLQAVDASSVTLNYGVRNAFAHRSDLGGMVDNPDQPASRASYVPTTSAAKYLPRIGHHVYNGSAWVNEGVLAESESRTNVLDYSSDFSEWTTTSSTITANDAVSPDGTESAYSIIHTATPADIKETINTTNTVTFSIYVKENSGSGYLRMLILDSDASPVNYVGAWFKTSDGTFGTAQENGTGSIVAKSVQDIGNGWYRVSLTGTVSGSATGSVRMYITDTDNTTVRSTTASQYWYGAQVEAGSTPSSLVPTSGSTVTRPAETFTIPSANLPWPEPQYIGSELVTNGTFDTDLSGWTAGASWSWSDGKAEDSGTTGPELEQTLTTEVGKVYSVSLDVYDLSGGTPVINVASNIIKSITAEGRQEAFFVAGGVTSLLSIYGTNALYKVDNVSVREINPLSVSIAMDGRVTYADEDAFGEAVLVYWQEDSNNKIRQLLTTNAGTGKINFEQEASNVTDYSGSDGSIYVPDILVSFNITSRHGSTFVNGAVDGLALTANTTPTALPDLSATDLDLANDYMGTIGTFRVWDRDLGDTGIEEATNPSLEPSLSLTFEGVGVNSFVVNDWSQ